MIYKSALRKLRSASLISEISCALVRCALLISKTNCALLILKTRCALVRCALLIYGKMPPSGCWQCTKTLPFIFYPKLSDVVLLDTTLSLVCAKRRICNERKERDPIFLYTKENAQLLYSPQAEWAKLAATN